MARKSDNGTTATKEKTEGFSAAEKAAMKERAKELKAASRRESKAEKAARAEREMMEKIAELPQPDRTLGERIHAIVTASAPDLSPKLWYGMPAYANEDGKIVCFFTPASKFDERYASFSFNAVANLDDGTMWPTSFALTELTADDEARIGKLVKKAVS